MKPGTVEPDTTDTAVAELRGIVSGLATEIKTVANSVQALTGVISDFVGSVNSRFERMQVAYASGQRPNWQAITAGCALVLTIVAMVGAAVGWGFSRDQNRTEEVLREGIKAAIVVSRDLGVAHSERASLRSDLDRFRDEFRGGYRELDSKLQREQALIGAALDSRITAFDGRLQGEIMAIADDLRLTRDRQRSNEQREVESVERIRALERGMYPQKGQ